MLAPNKDCYDGSNAMKGKSAVVLLLGLLVACVQAQPQEAAAPPPAPAPAATPVPATEAPAGDRIVTIRRATCERFLQLSAEDRAAASMFYIGYQSSRSRARTVNVNLLPSIEALALDYCSAYPNRPVAAAFAQADWETRRW
jgi:hypothetical protein